MCRSNTYISQTVPTVPLILLHALSTEFSIALMYHTSPQLSDACLQIIVDLPFFVHGCPGQIKACPSAMRRRTARPAALVFEHACCPLQHRLEDDIAEHCNGMAYHEITRQKERDKNRASSGDGSRWK